MVKAFFARKALTGFVNGMEPVNTVELDGVKVCEMKPIRPSSLPALSSSMMSSVKKMEPEPLRAAPRVTFTWLETIETALFASY